MANAFAQIPVRTDVDGDVVVGIAAGQSVAVTGTVSLGAGAASIGSVDINAGQSVGLTGVNVTSNALDVNLTNTSVTVSGTVNIGTMPSVTIGSWSAGTLDVNITNASIAVTGTVTVDSITNPLPAGTNTIGSVEIVTTGTTVHEHKVTGSDVTANGGTQTISSTAITNGNTATLRKIDVGSSVAMFVEVLSNDTVTPVVVDAKYIPQGGGGFDFNFLNGAVDLAGTAAGENFQVRFTNLDKKDDAEAHATFTWTEV